ncbi:hypothetical protein AN644_05075, partial [Candidatus Epulonipiscium fishelsonii]
CGLYLTHKQGQPNFPPKQIVGGFTKRFQEKLRENGGLTEPQLYGNTYLDVHETRVWKKTADELITQSGASILYHSYVVDIIKEETHIKGIVVATDNGMGIIKCKNVIDSSGNGIVAVMAGEDFTCGKDGVVQNPTIIFKLGNIDYNKFWDYYGKDTICHDEFSDKIRQAEKELGATLPRKKIWTFKAINDTELIVNATAINHDTEKLNMIYPEHFTYSEIEARKQLESYAEFFRKYIPGCENAFIGETSCEVGVRQTRSIKCKYTLKDEDVRDCKTFEDGIVKSSWPIELHRGEAPYLYWLEEKYYEIPFSAFQPIKTSNLVVAGRCLSAEHAALASARVTAQCFEYGRAAAIGAYLAQKEGVALNEVDGKKVKQLM